MSPLFPPPPSPPRRRTDCCEYCRTVREQPGNCINCGAPHRSPWTSKPPKGLKTFADFSAEQGIDIEDHTRRFIAECQAELRGRTHLVMLDDYDFIPTGNGGTH